MNSYSDAMDSYLKESLRYLRDNGDNEGIVGAGIVDPQKGEVQYAVSSNRDSEKIIHAERNAAEQFVDKYGQPSNDAFIVISLSPCIRYDELNDRRKGVSCTDLLLGNDEVFTDGIDRVHTGYIDPWQANREEYEESGLNVSVSDDPEIREYCENLFGYFKQTEEEMRDMELDEFVDNALNGLK